MARNKNPEETVNRILDTAYRLFLEKGYEQTSIQDIINHLGGLSKGAIQPDACRDSGSKGLKRKGKVKGDLSGIH